MQLLELIVKNFCWEIHIIYWPHRGRSFLINQCCQELFYILEPLIHHLEPLIHVLL